MNKLIYTRLDGGVSVVIPAKKSEIERVMGPLTDKEYEQHVYNRSIPKDAINIRELSDSDIPDSREFRSAWVDITSESKIDISCEKAKDIQLVKLRKERDKLLSELDKEFMMKLEKNESLDDVKLRKQKLRDITEPLKALDVSGKLNDIKLIDKIKELSVIK